MGQYHTIFNATKKEYFSFGGAKLYEKMTDPVNTTALFVLLSNSNGRGGGDFMVYDGYDYDKKGKQIWSDANKKNLQMAINEIQGRWAGDKIVIQGDYAEPKDNGFLANTDGFTDITGLILNALVADDDLKASIKSEMGFLKKIKSLRGI